ncbi:uncharacterized protein EAE97_003179 [Botrytis byssoidea]|uniref:Uncharacterized protein n=1 Tax=Botrytis byssoidea TaxID=139641 RepID=A0A9P5M8C3_9HELO|nr:uncharacterized protein EAE97_003179 [Botrytis byssoidea]KAF7949670.1 hypothetical protein EAE97_003179 [Botrytis byssoidea]
MERVNREAEKKALREEAEASRRLRKESKLSKGKKSKNSKEPVPLPPTPPPPPSPPIPTKAPTPEPDEDLEPTQEEVDEILALGNRTTTAKPASQAFSFWGAPKKSPVIEKPSPSKDDREFGKTNLAEASTKNLMAWGTGSDEIAIADKAMRPETSSKSKDTTTKWPPPSIKSSLLKKPVGGTIADRLRAFEANKPLEEPHESEEEIDEYFPAPSPPPPAAPPVPTKEERRKLKSSRRDKERLEDSEILPGAFPDSANGDEIIDIVEMPIQKKNRSKSSKSKEFSRALPVPIEPPTPPPEVDLEREQDSDHKYKKERPRVVRDGSSWGAWGAEPRKEEREKKPSRDRERRSDEPQITREERRSTRESDPRHSKSRRSSTREEKTSSSKDSSSDKADKASKGDNRPPVSRGISNMFGPATPLSRSNSKSEKRPSMSRTSSRRQSVNMDSSNYATPIPDDSREPPPMSAKAAKMFGIGVPGKLSRSKSEKTRPSRDDDVVGDDVADPIRQRSSRDRKGKSKVTDDSMFDGQALPPVPMPPPPMDIPIRRKTRPTTDWTASARAYQQRRQDDVDMEEQGGPSEIPGTPGLKRTDSSARKSGLGGMFGVFGKKDKEKDRPDLKRRSTAPAEDENRAYRRDERKTRRSSRDVDPEVTMTGAISEEEKAAAEAARRDRKDKRKAAAAERDANQRGTKDVQTAKEEPRKERHRREEKDERHREARHTAKRDRRPAAEADEPRVEEEREAERRARKRRKAAQVDGEQRGEDPYRSKHRRSHKDPDDDEAHRRPRTERVKSSDPRKSSRKSAPAPEPEFLPADGQVHSRSKPRSPAWPHSGTGSWVKENADAPPPPNSPTREASPVDETYAGEAVRRELRRTRLGGTERRRKDERYEKEKEKERPTRSPEGSQEDPPRESQRDSGFETSRAPSASAGFFGLRRKFGF